MKTALRFCEFAFITLGLGLLAVYAFFRMHGWFFQAYDSWSFDQVMKDRTYEADVSQLPESQPSPPNVVKEPETANYRDWAPARVLAHEKSLKRELRGI